VFDNTAEVLNHRPKSNTKNMELFKAIHRSQHVQRNFDLTRDMPEDDIATIVTAATQCPSKQNVAFYKLHVITDRNTIGQIYSTCKATPNPDNPQVLGNLVFVFEEYENYDLKSPNINTQILAAVNPKSSYHKEALTILEQDRFTALGIAAGYVNLVSSQLGYGTGCCSCILDAPKLKSILGLKKEPLLVMGIGYKQDGKNRRVHHLKNTEVFATRKKQPIEINYTHYT
jgi:nitroreductase